MSKTKHTRFHVEDRRFQDGANSDFHHIREERNRDKRKERRFDQALRTKNIDVLLERDDEDYLDDYLYNLED